MKVLRLLAFTLLLSVPCVHAMEQVADTVVQIGKSALWIASTLVVADGVSTLVTSEGPTIPQMCFDLELNDSFEKKAFAVAEVAVGLTALAYTK